MNKSGEPVLLNKKTTFSDDSDTLSNDGSDILIVKLSLVLLEMFLRMIQTIPHNYFFRIISLTIHVSKERNTMIIFAIELF